MLGLGDATSHMKLDDPQEEDYGLWDDVVWVPDVPTVEYVEPNLLVIYGPNSSPISVTEDRPFKFGFCSTEG